MPRTLTTQAALLTASRSVGQVLNALAAILIVRTLTQFDYGDYRQLILLFSTLIAVGDLGFIQGLYQFVPREHQKAGLFLGQALLIVLTTAATVSGGLLFFSQSVSNFFGNPQLTSEMAPLAAYVSLHMLTQVLESGLITLERIGLESATVSIFESVRFVLILAALEWNPTVAWLLRAMVVATAVRLLFLLYRLRREIRFAITSQFLDQFRYSMALWLGAMLNTTGAFAHQYIAGHYFNPAQYAIYAVACFQIPLMGVLNSSIADVLLVRITRHRGEGRQGEIYRVWLNACRKSLLFFLPITVGLAVVSKPLITMLFTDRYLASVPLFVLILMGLPFNAIFQDNIFRAFGAMRTYTFFYVLRVVLSIGLGLAGVRWLGLWGVALSTALTTIILNAAQLVKVAHLLRVSFARVLPWKDIGKMSIVSVACAVTAGLSTLLISKPMFALGIALALFGISYVALVLRSGLLSREETHNLLEEAKVSLGWLAFLRPKPSC